MGTGLAVTDDQKFGKSLKRRNSIVLTSITQMLIQPKITDGYFIVFYDDECHKTSAILRAMD